MNKIKKQVLFTLKLYIKTHSYAISSYREHVKNELLPQKDEELCNYTLLCLRKMDHYEQIHPIQFD